MTVTALATPDRDSWKSTMPVWAVLLMDRLHGRAWRDAAPMVKRMPKTVEVTVNGGTTTLRRRSF